MDKKRLSLILAILTGSILRLWALGTNPPSLSWDEAALGYNAYSILKTGKDEWGIELPLTLKSFHDYKPALYAYVDLPFVYFLGLNAWAVRLPSALAGILALVIMPFLTFRLVEVLEIKPARLAWPVTMVSTWLLAISPWSLQFSRGAFEANLALTLFLGGATLFLWSEKIAALLPPSVGFLAMSLYAYHSPRLVAPLWLLGGLIFWRQRLVRSGRMLGVALALGLVLSLPLLRIGQYGGLFGRWQGVMISTESNPSVRPGLLNQPVFEFGRSFISGYLAHFNPQFLAIRGDASRENPANRHHAVATGMLLWLSLPFFYYGLYRLVLLPGKGKFFLIYWLLLGPIPAALTKEAPHAIRALLLPPLPEFLTGLGMVWAVTALKSGRRWAGAGLGVFLALNFFIYWHNYQVHTPQEWSQVWQYGYAEAVRETQKLAPSYSRVVVTRKYDQPYIFFLFYGQVDPAWYQAHGNQEGFGNYQFRLMDLSKEDPAGTLLVAAPDQIGEKGRVLKRIYFLDGSEAFRLVDFPDTPGVELY